jgi:Transposase DDE domain
VFKDLNEIAALKLTPGHVADTAPVPALTKDLIGKLFGDQGYLGKKRAEELLHRGLTLFTRVRKNRKSLPLSMIDKMLLNGRNIAETIIGNLKGFSSLNLPKHRRPSNGFLPIMAALVADQLDPIKPNHAFFSHHPPAITAG